jgi:hypothetical protein
MALETQVSILAVEIANLGNNDKKCKISQLRIVKEFTHRR